MRRRLSVGARGLSPALILAVAAAALPTAASAQGLFDFLFGGPSKPAVQAPVQPVLLPPAPLSRRPFPAPYERPAIDDDGYDGGRGRADDRGQFTTVCVRLCDGYYWPIQHGGRRRDFERDSRLCQSSCGEEARLFYMPKSSSIESAVDLAGKPYAKLPNALLYRRKLINGCACRPSPWSEAEAIRHATYALREAEARRRAEEARRAAEIAAHDGISAPIGSFRAAQELGPVRRPPMVAALEDPVEALDGAWPASVMPVAQPARTRRAKTDARPRDNIRSAARATGPVPRPTQIIVQTPGAPVLFGGGKSFTWPGDPVRR